MTFRIFCLAFNDGESIPRQYTCDGADISPALQWEDAPSNTISFALIVQDPDAPGGDWTHWVLYNISPDRQSLPEAYSSEESSLNGVKQGRNSWHQIKYGGPCPPSGTHRYFFTLYALDSFLEIETGASQQELVIAMQSHILAQTQLMGTYTRK